MSARRRQPKPLKRAVARRPELRTIVVFTEGSLSEPDYVNGLRRLPHVRGNVALRVEIHPEHRVPLTLVRMAVERARDPEVDECWCIFDVEWPKNHPNLDAALALARENGVRLAISNPCFELWLILHHQDHARFDHTAAVESLSRKLDGRAGKSIDAAAYLPLRGEASRRAESLAKRHEREGRQFPNDNPSSGMYLFLKSLEGR
jgi:hypothetical protein